MTESWLGAPIQRTATVVGGGGVRVFASVGVCACVMCLQYTKNYILVYPG